MCVTYPDRHTDRPKSITLTLFSGSDDKHTHINYPVNNNVVAISIDSYSVTMS